MSLGLVGQRISEPVRVAGNTTVRFVFEGNELRVEWEPGQPHRLKGRALERYRRARDAFVAQLLEEAGGGSAVVLEPSNDEAALRIVGTPHTTPENCE